MESMAADEDFEPNQDSSFSEDELLPRRSSSVPERSSTPGQYAETSAAASKHGSRCSQSTVVVFLSSAPVQCVLDKDSLVDGLRVLIPMDDQLLYAGHVNTVHSPDM